MTAGKILALMDGRFNVSIDDVRAAALPALRHRVILNFEGEAEGITTEAVVRVDPGRGGAARRRVADPARSAMTASPTPPADTPDEAAAKPARPPAAPTAHAGGVKAFLPNELDPTVFDEGFLRQLERLGVLMKQPVRGGLKGGRRSVKRGQSVEFADYREYALGDDLRQLDWNVLRPPREAVREAVRRGGGRDDHVPRRRQPVDGLRATARSCCSRSGRRPRSGTSGSRSEDRVVVTALTGRTARRQGGLRGSGRVFRLLANLSSIQPADGPTDLVASRAPRRRRCCRAAGVVVLLSDLLDPGADRVIRELAATGSELIVLHLLSPDELDPALEGDLRLVDSEIGRGHRRHRRPRDARRLQGAARRLAGRRSPTSPPSAARRTCRCPRTCRSPTSCSPSCAAGAWSGRPRCRSSRRWRSPGSCSCPLVVAMYLLKLRRDEAVVPSTLLWQRARRRRRGERAVAAAAPEPPAPPPAAARR